MMTLKFIIIALILSFSAASKPQLGCRFCASCGGLFPYSGGRKRNDGDWGDWMIYGSWCSGDQPHQDLYTEWSLCCTKDYNLDDGTCKFCTSCGSNYPYNMGSRLTDGDWGGFDIMAGSCSGQLYNSFSGFNLCCTQPSLTSFCTSCQKGQISSGGKLNQHDWGPWALNLYEDCGKMNNLLWRWDQFNLCSNPCLQGSSLQNGSCVENKTLCGTECDVCSDAGTCVSCKNRSILIGGTCKQCDLGYFVQNNTCKPCGIAQCTECTSQNLCTKCLSGHSPVQGSCIEKCGDECETCSDSATCLSCKNRYILNQGTCKACDLGYYVDNNVCKPCGTQQCIVCTSPYLCLTCLSGNQPVQGYYSFQSNLFSASLEGIKIGSQDEYHPGVYCFSQLNQVISLAVLLLLYIHIV